MVMKAFKEFKSNPGERLLVQGEQYKRRKRCEICSNLRMKHQKDVTDVVLVFLLFTLNVI